ncbi:MAG: hypothetical protein RMX65_004840 [Nostoc sp. DedQUE01]
MSLSVIENSVEGLQNPIANSHNSYEIYKQQVIASSTAQEILKSLEQSSKVVGILLIDEEYDSMYIPPFLLENGPVNKFDGGIAVVNITSQMKIENTDIPIGVSLMHELGHAKQYIENPTGFETKYKEAMGEQKTNYPSELTKQKKGKKISQLVIENENVALHEAPVCHELGLPYRKRYD